MIFAILLIVASVYLIIKGHWEITPSLFLIGAELIRSIAQPDPLVVVFMVFSLLVIINMAEARQQYEKDNGITNTQPLF